MGSGRGAIGDMRTGDIGAGHAPRRVLGAHLGFAARRILDMAARCDQRIFVGPGEAHWCSGHAGPVSGLGRFSAYSRNSASPRPVDVRRLDRRGERRRGAGIVRRLGGAAAGPGPPAPAQARSTGLRLC